MDTEALLSLLICYLLFCFYFAMLRKSNKLKYCCLVQNICVKIKVLPNLLKDGEILKFKHS